MEDYDEEVFVYFMESVITTKKSLKRKIKYQPVKIGFARDVDNRMKYLQCGNPNKILLRMAIPVADEYVARRLEGFLHERLSFCHIRGEWFNLHGQNIKYWLDKFYSTHKKWLETYYSENYPNVFDVIESVKEK